MREKKPVSDKRIINCLNIDYGIEVDTLTFLPLGADMHAIVYKAQAQDLRSYFVKLKRGHHHDKARGAQRLRGRLLNGVR